MIFHSFVTMPVRNITYLPFFVNGFIDVLTLLSIALIGYFVWFAYIFGIILFL